VHFDARRFFYRWKHIERVFRRMHLLVIHCGTSGSWFPFAVGPTAAVHDDSNAVEKHKKQTTVGEIGNHATLGRLFDRSKTSESRVVIVARKRINIQITQQTACRSAVRPRLKNSSNVHEKKFKDIVVVVVTSDPSATCLVFFGPLARAHDTDRRVRSLNGRSCTANHRDDDDSLCAS